jgi:26S proteasome regulatory subunit N6
MDQIARRAALAAGSNTSDVAEMEIEMESFNEELDGIDELATSSYADAAAKYNTLATAPMEDGERGMKKVEVVYTRAATLFAKLGKADDLKALIELAKPLMSDMSKAKGGKLFRVLIEKYLEVEPEVENSVSMCVGCVAWAKESNRRFLKQALEIVLTGLHVKACQYQESLAVAQPLIRELKKFDDKLQLVEVQLIESRAYYALSNYPRSRASLVSARTTANAIYCPPKMQAALDIMSGIVHAQEKDFKTAFSYFYESFEGFDSVDEGLDAVSALKYMLLCKIMLSLADDVPGIINGKLAIKYSVGENASSLDAMRAIAKSNQARSLAEFEEALKTYQKELGDDIIIQSHVNDMYDEMLQNNLCRIVEPYEVVEIEHIAKLIDLPVGLVETKLSQMILDKKMLGILDQGAGCLEVFTDTADDKAYSDALQTIHHTSQVVEALFEKAKKLY